MKGGYSGTQGSDVCPLCRQPYQIYVPADSQGDDLDVDVQKVCAVVKYVNYAAGAYVHTA